jgi:hypothetical protein
MLDATDLAYLPVVLEITGYATIYSVLCAAPGLKPLWLPESGGVEIRDAASEGCDVIFGEYDVKAEVRQQISRAAA